MSMKVDFDELMASIYDHKISFAFPCDAVGDSDAAGVRFSDGDGFGVALRELLLGVLFPCFDAFCPQ